jgi:hypothetical protein
MRLWFPILIPPLAALAHVTANYAVVPFACENQQRWPMHLVSLLFIAVAVAGVVLAYGAWRDYGAAPAHDDAAPASRARFLALLGILISLIMTASIFAQWLTAVFIPPCVR